jgi:hypothetical protein
MSDLALPPPDRDDALLSSAPESAGRGQREKSAGSRQRKRRRSTGTATFTMEDILAQLNSLKGMVAAGWITPAQANAITRILQLMMQSLQQGGPRRAASAIPDEILADLARKDPAILDLLAPFLTDEQFDAILADHVKDDQRHDD